MADATSVFARDDTLLGICQAIADDFGFKPTYLRLAFAGILFWSFTAAFAAYAALGAVVALSRWMVPEPAHQPEKEEAAADEAPAELALAA
jgi:phage shock protein PspC (stress-responsive transcriptional regulator)